MNKPEQFDEITNEIIKEIDKPFEKGGYKLSNTHFENGLNLHCKEYYFAQKFFRNTSNCELLNKLIEKRIADLGGLGETTIIGFRSYSSMLLQNLCEHQSDRLNYGIIEIIKDSKKTTDKRRFKFIWKLKPEFKDNIVVFLPIVSTTATYLKIRKWILDELKSVNKAINVQNTFISAFIILDDSLKKFESTGVNITNDETLLKKYSQFKWERISSNEENQVTIRANSKTLYTLYSCVRLYSKMYLPEECELCFAELSKKTDDKRGLSEKPVFPTNDFETPNLIFGYQKFPFNEDYKRFVELFIDSEKTWNILLYGHVVVDGRSYLSYIRGNVFYEKNRRAILDFFHNVIDSHLNKVREIIFVTHNNKYLSSFLQEFGKEIRERHGKISSTILQFEPSKEWVDNFLTLYEGELSRENALLIYFEDVLSAASTFKLLNDIIVSSGIKSNKENAIGFDLLFTLVDRTLLRTQEEIKIKLNFNSPSVNRFFSFFKLNVPIIAASHLGNPFDKEIQKLRNIKANSYLDTLRNIYSKMINSQLPKPLPENEMMLNVKTSLTYFQFANIESGDFVNVFEHYKSRYNKEYSELFKLFITDILNTELSHNYTSYFLSDVTFERKHQLIESIINNVFTNYGSEIFKFFAEDENSIYRNIEIEREIIHDILVKLLSRAPFVYFKNIHEGIFEYCIFKLDEIQSQIESSPGGIKSFNLFRKLKFYVKRTVELNSNFILSTRFLESVKSQYDRAKIKRVISQYRLTKENLYKRYRQKEINEEYLFAAVKNVEYKEQQVTEYFTWLITCYKELVFNNPYRAIRLETVLETESIIPDYVLHKGDDKVMSLQKLIRDPYFQFIGKVKVENHLIIKELLELHSYNRIQSKNFRGIDYVNYYFDKGKKDPVIIQFNKFYSALRIHRLGNKKLHDLMFHEYKRAISCLLKFRDLLIDKDYEKKTTKLNSIDELKKILGSMVEILDSDSNNKLNYVFVSEVKKSRSSKDSSVDLFTLCSNDAIDTSELIKFNRDGFVYNLLHGLQDSWGNEQTLLTFITDNNGQLYSFNEKLKGNKDKLIDAEEYYNHDIYNPVNDTGLNILASARMCIALRLSDFYLDSESIGIDKLVGRAVLIITSEESANIDSFLNYFNDDKIRLLLAAKEELSPYLKKLLDNDVFDEIISKNKEQNISRTLIHGVGNYLKAIDSIIGKEDLNNNLPLLRSIINRLDIQFSKAFNDVNYQSYVNDVEIHEFSEVEIKSLFKDIMEAPHIARKTLKEDEYQLIVDVEPIKSVESFFSVVLPELFLNMRKHSLTIKNRIFRINYQSKVLTLENSFDIDEYRTSPSRKIEGGKEMCKILLANHAEISSDVDIDKGIYTVKIMFK